jgi:hypothetical protein
VSKKSVEDGIDFYIDGARFLPDNVTWTRVRIRVYNSDIVRDKNISERAVADIDKSTARNPFYGFKLEIRSKIDPTSLVIMTLETWDRSSK